MRLHCHRAHAGPAPPPLTNHNKQGLTDLAFLAQKFYLKDDLGASPAQVTTPCPIYICRHPTRPQQYMRTDDSVRVATVRRAELGHVPGIGV